MAELDIMRRGQRVYIVLSFDSEAAAIVAYHEAWSSRLDEGYIHISDDNRHPPIETETTGVK